jgi:isoquinoline 1-oxidoreductase beta subunit
MPGINRRDFIRLGAASSAGLLIGIPLQALPSAAAASLHPLIRIGEDGEITLYAQNPEMGQGVKTALPMLIAEELDVDWRRIRVRQADWDPRLENQFSGGSLSVRLNYDAMRQAGASARMMLLSAAAARLDRPPGTLSTHKGHVVDEQSGRRLRYADLAFDAAALPVPDDPVLKSSADFTLVGHPVADVDLDEMLTGRQTYSLDLTLPGMLYAVVKRCPHGDGQPLSFDTTEAEAVAGVVDFHASRPHSMRTRRPCAATAIIVYRRMRLRSTSPTTCPIWPMCRWSR